MKYSSIWKDSIDSVLYPVLDKNMEVDVLIIGGGITGISTLYYLKNSGLNVALVEQNKVGFSVTGSSTGKLTYLQNDLIDKIRKNFSDDKAYKYIKAQKDAIKSIVDIIRKERIDCNLKRVNSFVYTNLDNEISKLKDMKTFFNKYNIRTIDGEIDLVSSKYSFGVTDTYMFNPLQFIYGILKKNKYNVFENTSIIKIEKDNMDRYLCYTDNYVIKTKWVVVASHYPYFLKPFFFPLKGSLEKSYLSASLYNGKDVSFISYSYPFVSARTYGDYCIYLSNSHSNSNCCNDKKHFQELLKKVNELDLRSKYLWSNIDIMTNDGLPYIGRIKEKMLIGTGYNTWGLSNGVLAGRILSDIILKKNNEYLSLFNPRRINIYQVIGGISSSFHSFIGYISGYLNRSKVINDKCPHLGCYLIYNDIEHTWDCPCHGSRFDKNGRCISGPANKNISVKKK